MPETTKLHPKQPVAAALASRAAVRPALRQGGAFALGLAGGWAVLYGALLPFGLGLTLGLPADCFAACAAGAALSILFHGFGAFSLDSLCLLCAVGAAVAARWLWPGRLRPAFLAGCGALVLGGVCFALGPGGAGFTLVFFCGADALLAGGFSEKCYDGQPFFSDAHKVGNAALPTRKARFWHPAGRFCRGGGAGRAALRPPLPWGSGLCHGGCHPLLPWAGKARAGLCCFHRGRALRSRPFPCPGGGGALLRHGGSGPAGPRAAG